MSITTYKNYFRSLAILNKMLGHDPASEAPEAPAGGCHFTMFTQSDVVTNALKRKIGDGFCLHLHCYDRGLADNGAGDQKDNYDGGFIVSKKTDVNNVAQMEAAYADTEVIVNQIIDKMCLDFFNAGPTYCSFPLGHLDLSKLNCSPVGPLWDNRFGWFVTFPFHKARAASPDDLEARVAAAFTSEQKFEPQFSPEFE